MPILDVTMFKAIRMFFKVIGLIPRPLARRCGNAMGRFWYVVDRRHRKIVLRNLRHAFGQEKSGDEIRSIAKSVFKNLSQIIFEIGWSMWQSREDFEKYIRVEGVSDYLKAWERGKGVLLLVGHVGNWELLPIASWLSGKKVNTIYRPMDFRPLDLLFAYLRSRFGDDVVPREGSLKKIISFLRRGQTVAMLMDQNVGWRKGVFVEFFGRRACTNKAMALLAMKTGAAVVPLLIAREGDCYRVKWGPEVPLIQTGDKTRDVEENTRQYNDVLEAFIRQYPDQWLWMHQRWKTRPYHPWPRQQ
ncbi:MAG: lysophospholipid acyltransferase family protein [Desulfobacterales bacterium]|nr:lysophospholipid acyltransferase family protein [Desulfobacterales bacterium]